MKTKGFWKFAKEVFIIVLGLVTVPATLMIYIKYLIWLWGSLQ